MFDIIQDSHANYKAFTENCLSIFLVVTILEEIYKLAVELPCNIK